MAAPINKAKFTQDINAPIKAVYGGGLMFNKDNLSNVISVDIVDGGLPFDVTGTVSGTVIRSDGTTVPVNTGAISGNTVSLTLTEACFDVPGQIVVNIIVTNGDVKCCVLRAVYTVVPTETSAVVDPGDILPSIADLIDDIDAAVASIPADYSGLLASIAGTFSTSTAYAAGSYVWYDGTLYRFTAAHAAGSWTGSDAATVTIGGELADLKSDFEKISEKSINLMPVESLTSVVNGVNINYENGIITRSGTATVDGGRLNHITPTFMLSAGTYAFWISTTGATLFIENASTNAIIATAINNAVAQFTLSENTEVYIGTNMVSGATYNDSYEVQIERGNAKTEFQPPNMLTAFDEVAREASNLALDFSINNAFSAFMKFGVVGDSLAVGYTGDGVSERNPEYSWGRILARRLGNICQLFAKAGTTTKNWFTDPYCYSELIRPDNKCQAYIIGIGTNDTISASFPIGTTADINLSDSSLNADSFCGWYGKIIQAIIGVNSAAKIFVFTIPYPRVDNTKNDAIRAISELFDNVYLVDLADEYNDLFMTDAVTDFAVNSHFSSGGYANLAVINNYILSLIIKNNASDFIDIPHIPYGSADDVT